MFEENWELENGYGKFGKVIEYDGYDVEEKCFYVCYIVCFCFMFYLCVEECGYGD